LSDLLDAKDVILVRELLLGRTVVDAAKAAGLSESQAFRRLRDERVRRELSAARQELVTATVAQLAAASSKAVATLLELLDAPTPDAVRRNAAKDILASVRELGEHADEGDLAGRLQAIEARLGIGVAA
jgi:hypothetical protein